MRGWTPIERRWRDVLLAAAIPPGERHPGLASVPPEPFWTEFEQAAPPILKVGFRSAVWALTWAPVLLEAAPLHELDEDRRDAVLQELAASRNPLVRQWVLAVKLVACFAYFRDDRVRAGWEAP